MSGGATGEAEATRDQVPTGRVGHAGRGKPRIIAIDGPAGAGKSTVAEALAQRLGYLYFDTGVLYRAVTLAALRRKIAVNNEAALAALVGEIHIDVEVPRIHDGRTLTVLLDGEDVTWAIRTPEVERNVSAVSAQAAVRQALLQRQREVAARGGVIMAGRDIGTVVLPDADLKLYLEASPKVRAKRRQLDEEQRGQERPYNVVLGDILRRDDIDTHRAVSPLRMADDARLIDTEDVDIAGVLAAIDRVIAEWGE